MKTFILVLNLMTAVIAAAQPATQPATTDDVKTLFSYMSGSFASLEQSQTDQTYFDVRLHMVPIWTDRAGEYWLYVEQAMATTLEEPYRQRVYQLKLNRDGTITSEVYTLPDEPLKYACAWKQEHPLKDLSPEKLTLREGCAIVLHKNDDRSFSGSTIGKGCVSNLRGASHATSEVHIAENQLTSWDRGFDDKGKQVWGAVKGAYVFKKDGK